MTSLVAEPIKRYLNFFPWLEMTNNNTEQPKKRQKTEKMDVLYYVTKSYRYCIYDGCMTTASYNIAGNPRRFCAKHKSNDMINVKTARCIHDGCMTIPSYNLAGEKARYCVKHKKENMIDVTNPRCIHEGCMTRPTYKLAGKKDRFCSKHKTKDMVNIYYKKNDMV